MFGFSTSTVALIGLLSSAAIFGAGWNTGHNSAMRRANIAALKSEIAAAKADIALHQKTAQQAKAAHDAMEQHAVANAAKIKELSDALAKNYPAGSRDNCRLDADTARRLRAIR
ncbi:MAG: hypothetical protein ACRCTD_15695 [Beijerinckiaceae bacterium]